MGDIKRIKQDKVGESEGQKHSLTERSWLLVVRKAVHCSKVQFSELWDIRPETPGNVMMYGKLIPIPRLQRLYGDHSYTFSGVTVPGEKTIPDLVQRCIEYSKAHYPNFAWNGALVNWYPDGKSYIGAHSDDEKDLATGAPILSFSFGGVRTFRVKQKPPHKLQMDLLTEHGSVFVMGGAMQQEFKHEITKTAKYVGPRMNVTVRCFA